MTLVVAKKKGEVLSLVSDTGISLNGALLGPDKQMPKLCILNRSLAVAFCGSPDLALRTIQAAPKDDRATYRSITNHFLDAHRQHDNDFILAFGPPLSKLALVADGTIKQNRTTEWIGDKDGFEAFQEFRQKRESTLPHIKTMLGTSRKIEAEGKLPTFDMIGTMRTVIERDDVPSVFGHPVGINNVTGSFEFLNYTVTLEELSSFEVPATVSPARVLGQIAEAQAYAFSCFVNSPGDASDAVAFHYMRGKFTYVYYGKAGEPLSNFVLYKDMNVLEIGERAQADLGVTWVGGITSRTGLPIGYGVPADQWRNFQFGKRR